MKQKNEIDLTLCARVICERFELQSLTNEEISENELLAFLAKAIAHYLDKDFNKLLNILYRIDIRETDIQQTLTVSPPDEIAKQLAIKVIEREKQKMISRQKYRD